MNQTTHPNPHAQAQTYLPIVFASFAALRRVSTGVQTGKLPGDLLDQAIDRHTQVMGICAARLNAALA